MLIPAVPIETNMSAYLVGSPFANPFIIREDGSSYEIKSKQVEIHQHEYRHEVAIVYMDQTKSALNEVCLGRPIFIRYGRLPNRFTYFSGYLYGVKPFEVPDDGSVKKGAIPVPPKVIVFAIGATWRLKDPAPRVWENLTTKQILHEICRQNYLTLEIAEEDFGANHLWREIVQPSNISTWEFMVDLCKKSGLTMYPKQTTIYVHPRSLVPRSVKESAPFFADRQVREFKAEHSNDFPGNDSNTSVSIDQVDDGGNVVSTSNGPRPSIQLDPLLMLCRRIRREYSPQSKDRQTQYNMLRSTNNMQPPTRRWLRPERLPNSSYEGIFFQINVEERMNAWPTTALAHLKGHAMVSAGEVVKLDPHKQYPDPHRGYWYVSAVWHVFVPGDYYLRTELGNNNAAPIEEDTGTPLPWFPWIRPTIPEDEEEDNYPGVGTTVGRPSRPTVRPLVIPPILTNPQIPGTNVIIPEEPDGPVIGVPIAVPSPEPEPPRYLGGPSCPVQPRPWLPQEWRSSWIGPLDYNAMNNTGEELVGL